MSLTTGTLIARLAAGHVVDEDGRDMGEELRDEKLLGDILLGGEDMIRLKDCEILLTYCQVRIEEEFAQLGWRIE